VKKNDQVSVEDCAPYDRILLSPGPGLPSQAGIMPGLIAKYHSTKPILGICLGLQGIAEFFGCRLRNLERVYHGLATPVKVIAEDPMFEGVPLSFNAGRYHSWVVDRNAVSDEMTVTAIDDNNEVMAARHIKHNVRGVQFHPESILSEYGETIISNWLKMETATILT
jgi:anthranilate synthase component 2